MAVSLHEYTDASSKYQTAWKISYIYHMQMVTPQYEYVDATSRYLTAGKISYIYHN